jgi:hypothetical protein
MTSVTDVASSCSCLPTSFSGLMTMKPPSRNSPLSTPLPFWTRVRKKDRSSSLSACTLSWMTAPPAWKSIGAPAMVSVLTRSGCSAA